jgi:hypothetical protein
MSPGTREVGRRGRHGKDRERSSPEQAADLRNDIALMTRIVIACVGVAAVFIWFARDQPLRLLAEMVADVPASLGLARAPRNVRRADRRASGAAGAVPRGLTGSRRPSCGPS